MIVCPRCDGQGTVLKATITKLNRTIFLCDECDATWFDQHLISNTDFIDFTTYMEAAGLPAVYSEIEIVSD
jgi:hypothetical protein